MMRGNKKRSEALLNEYKGNLYEFLVAREIAQRCEIEADFVRGLRPDFHTMLAQQESFIREYYPNLLVDLPILARGLADKILKRFKTPPISAALIGKAASGEDNRGEADLVLRFSSSKDVFISIKLSRAQAFVNTKSAGVKSFLKKYFDVFSDIEDKQRELSAFFDREFDMFSRSLHETKGVEFSEDFSNWKSEGLTQLPGELEEDGRALFLGFISSISNKLFKLVQELYEARPKEFSHCLLPCLGHSLVGLIQVTTFYKTQGPNYELEAHEVEDLEIGGPPKLLESVNRPETSSFDLVFEDRVLQVRIKAMNKFTGKGFKVNCAVKRLS